MDAQLDWALEAFDRHRGVRRLVQDLNRPAVDSRPGRLHGRDQYLELPLPGLSVLVLKPER